MFHPFRVLVTSLPERLRDRLGERAAGIALTILVEILLVMALLTIVPQFNRQREVEMSVFSIEAQPDQPPSPEPEEAAAEPPAQPKAEAEKPAEKPPQPKPVPPEPEPAPVAEPPPLPIIPLNRQQMATANIARPAPQAPATPAAPAASAMMGPVNKGRSDDTQRVGTAPNGQPLYAAAWYREPFDDELRGYLSTARGPGWGLIACRTVAQFRVEDCVAVGEYPEGSNIARAVLAAAWQFRVRPPQRGGRPMTGEWVRIRIDYNVRRATN